MAKILELTTDNFKETIEKNAFVIVAFWAPWCEPCKNFTPVFEKAAENNKDIIFGMVDVEKYPEIGRYRKVRVRDDIRDRCCQHHYQRS